MLKHVEGTTFRVTFYIANSAENQFSRGLSIDIKFDDFSYHQNFKEININEFIQNFNDLDQQSFIKSFELVGDDVIKR